MIGKGSQIEIPCLSIKQPWAWLIMEGIKDVENRTWTTKYRGKLAIHAGKEFDWAGLDKIEWEFPDTAIAIKNHFRLNRSMRLTAYKLNPDTLDEFGALLGAVDLVGIDDDRNSIWCNAGCRYWRLTNPVKLDDPRPMLGRLGLFKIGMEA